MRASTWNAPRFLSCFDETVDGSLILPRGLLPSQVGKVVAAVVAVADPAITGTPDDQSWDPATGEWA